MRLYLEITLNRRHRAGTSCCPSLLISVRLSVRINVVSTRIHIKHVENLVLKMTMKTAVLETWHRVVWLKYNDVSEKPAAFITGVDKQAAWGCLL